MHSFNSDNNDMLFNVTTFVYIFYDKNKFTNFRRITKNQKQLYKTEVIIIKRQREIYYVEK